MQSLIIGDIHGCYDELQALLDKAGLADGDEIISIGDLVDRGPDSPRVLDFFRATPHARAILGNHERKHLRSHRGETQPALSQLITRWQFDERYTEALAYMATLPVYLDLPNALLVHGFFEPGLPITQQSENVIVGVLSGENYLKRRYDRVWYELYDGDKPLIVGHRNYNGYQPLVYRDRVYGIDTRCYEGGALTGLLLPGFRLISICSRKNYWAHLQQQFSNETGENSKEG
jgi:serine/threonine protein phosphatase 1